MMDTILNLGLNDVTVEALATETQDERFAYDCYRRFIQMYGNVVMGIDINRFEQYFEHMKETCEITEDHQLTDDRFETNCQSLSRDLSRSD